LVSRAPPSAPSIMSSTERAAALSTPSSLKPKLTPRNL
jgi:hypothetical protein